MDTSDHLDVVITALDRLLESGESYGGLFPSILDPGSGEMYSTLPPAIPGQ